MSYHKWYRNVPTDDKSFAYTRIYKKILQISQIVLKRFLQERVGINNVSDKIALSRIVRTGTSFC